ncbi:SDR family NAD(P)-dependent oxidoreductase [Actinomadura sp. 3N407]|uniref:SDR family NAD(P)-dependent oxidoreductase n=1 Tax=Actinomadura sp. 3N407 TaxID=3457423 RepID=UPI003FCC8659
MWHRQKSDGVVLITGASSGIGRATAQLFAENGFRVFGTSRRDRPDEHGVEMLRLDVRSDESVAHCVNQVLDRAGRIDVLVNNAGIMHEGFAEETTLQDAHAVFAANLFGVARVTNAALPGMRHRRRGRIINIGSLASWVGEPGEAFYAASKAAVARYTEALRHEVWPLGISVSLVEPGAFTTGVLKASSASEAAIADYDGAREAARRTLRQSLRGGGDPDKVAALIVKIARARSPRYRYGAGRDGRWVPLLKTLMPQRLLDRLLRRSFGLSPRHDTGPTS